jgi:hypothetical protein
MLNKKIAALLLLLPLIVLSFQLRAYVEAVDHLKRARAAAADHDYILAAEHYRETISWQPLFVDTEEQAAAELYELAINEKLETKLQLRILWILKSALDGRTIPLSDPASIGFEARLQREIESRVGSKMLIEEEVRSSLNQEFQILVHISFWLWLLSLVVLILKGFNQDGSMRKDRVAAILPISLLLFAVWLFSLYRA